MPQIVYDETFDGKGRVIASVPRVIPDPAPTDKERIAELEAQLAKLHGALDDVSKAASFADAKTKIADRIKDVELVEVPALPEEPIEPLIKAGR